MQPPSFMRQLEAKYIDIAERSLSALIQTFVAVMAVGGDGTLKTAAAAAIASALAVIQGSLATKHGDPDTAAFIEPHPGQQDPQT